MGEHTDDKKDREVVDAIGRKSFDEWTSADKLALFGIAVIATQSPPSAIAPNIEALKSAKDAAEERYLSSSRSIFSADFRVERDQEVEENRRAFVKAEAAYLAATDGGGA